MGRSTEGGDGQRDHGLEQELAGAVTTRCQRFFGTRDAVDLRSWRVLSGSDGSIGAEGVRGLSGLEISPDLVGSEGSGALGLDASSSLKLEYAEALRAGSAEGGFSVSMALSRIVRTVSFGGRNVQHVSEAAALGVYLLPVSKAHGVRGAEGPFWGPEALRLSGVQVSKALRSPRCSRFGAKPLAGLRTRWWAGFRGRGMEGSVELEVLKALRVSQRVDGFGTGGAEALRSGGTKSFGAEASAAQKRVLRRLKSSSRSAVSFPSGSEIVRLLVAKALEANRSE